MFRYFDLLAPVLGDNSVLSEVDSAVVDATLSPFIDKDPAVCKFKYGPLNKCNLCHYAFVHGIVMLLFVLFR